MVILGRGSRGPSVPLPCRPCRRPQTTCSKRNLAWLPGTDPLNASIPEAPPLPDCRIVVDARMQVMRAVPASVRKEQGHGRCGRSRDDAARPVRLRAGRRRGPAVSVETRRCGRADLSIPRTVESVHRCRRYDPTRERAQRGWWRRDLGDAMRRSWDGFRARGQRWKWWCRTSGALAARPAAEPSISDASPGMRRCVGEIGGGPTCVVVWLGVAWVGI